MRSAGVTAASAAARTSASTALRPPAARPSSSRGRPRGWPVDGEGDAAQRRHGLGDSSGGGAAEVELGDAGAEAGRVVLRAVAGRRQQERRRRRPAAGPTSSALVEKVLSGHADRADAGRGEPRHHEVGPVGVEDRDAGAGAGVGREQGPGQLGRAPVGLGVGERVVVADEQHVVGPVVDPGPQQRGHGERQVVAGVDHGRGHGRAPSGRHLGQRGAVAGDRVDLGLAQHPVAGEQLAGRADAPVGGGALDGEGERGEQRRRSAVAQRQRRRLARHADVAVVVLDGAVEEHGQEPAVHDARRALVGDRERDRARGPVAVDRRGRTRGSTG